MIKQNYLFETKWIIQNYNYLLLGMLTPRSYIIPLGKFI